MPHFMKVPVSVTSIGLETPVIYTKARVIHYAKVNALALVSMTVKLV